MQKGGALQMSDRVSNAIALSIIILAAAVLIYGGATP